MESYSPPLSICNYSSFLLMFSTLLGGQNLIRNILITLCMVSLFSARSNSSYKEFKFNRYGSQINPFLWDQILFDLHYFMSK